MLVAPASVPLKVTVVPVSVMVAAPRVALSL